MKHLPIRQHLRSFATAMPPSRLRFAPLSPTAPPTTAPSLAGIVFDVDGTLTLPQTWMFVKMRTALRISPGVDILSHVASLPSPDAAMELVRGIEREAMLRMQPSKGLVELMQYLERRAVRKGILTRNYECAPARFVSIGAEWG
jgi:hypothetical protein